jgi:hypothetical protein
MIHKLVQSALDTGWLSVESEGLIRQVLKMRGYQASDVAALNQLLSALEKGYIRREGRSSSDFSSLH